jgi:17beta-estradiol 17-dehydrogenase / very-long-chain 3-oxoacyl-CoA reductase
MPLPLVHYLYQSGLPKYLRQDSNGESSWALVTGASDGIGWELSRQLAERGFNIILHGRNESKLERCRKELAASFPNRHFRTVAVDASSFTDADIKRIVATAADIPLTILVNNVGGTAVLSSNFKHFEDYTSQEIDAVFSLNVTFPLKLTRAILPTFQAQHHPTLIMTCGSQSQIGQAYVAGYSATKGALHTWSRSLAAEQYEAKTQVEVLEVIVGGTYTQQLQKDPNMKPGVFMPTAEVMARAALARVGHGHRFVVGYFGHWVQEFLLYTMLPMAVADSIVAGILKPSVEAKKA